MPTLTMAAGEADPDPLVVKDGEGHAWDDGFRWRVGIGRHRTRRADPGGSVDGRGRRGQSETEGDSEISWRAKGPVDRPANP